jgi:predicted small secreted protein
MATKLTVQPRGSWILKVLIVILIVFLMTSILYPKKLWNEHEVMIIDSQERMENINSVVNRFYKVTGSYIADIDSLLDFMETDSIVVKRGVFEIEKLALYDAVYDSFLVGFPDHFHSKAIDIQAYYQGQKVNYVGDKDKWNTIHEIEKGLAVDSVVMVLHPKEYFSNVIDPVYYYMKADSGKTIEYYFREKGVKDTYWLIWSDGMLHRDYMEYDEKIVGSKDYLLYRDIADLRTEPITGNPYEAFLNTRISLEGKINYKVVRSGEPDPAILDSELKTNLLINKIARLGRGRLDQDMQRDSTLFSMQLELSGEYFALERDKLDPRRPSLLETDRELMVPADSVDNYRFPERIMRELYRISYDSLIHVWTDDPITQAILAKVTYEEQHTIGSETVIGVTIRPQFNGNSYKLPARGMLDRIFSVGAIENPGNVENNDLSWSETK